MTTLESNRLIAEFMGGKTKVQDPLFGSKYTEVDTSEMSCYMSLPRYISFQALKYHKSWDWLMPVISKINEAKVKGYHSFEVIIYSDETIVMDRGNNVLLFSSAGHGSIGNTYITATKFIKWYNENK